MLDISYSAPSALANLMALDPGRCPGLLHFAPLALGLRVLTQTLNCWGYYHSSADGTDRTAFWAKPVAGKCHQSNNSLTDHHARMDCFSFIVEDSHSHQIALAIA